MITFARILKARGYIVCFINLGYHSGEMLSWIVPEFELVSFGFKRTMLSLFRIRQFFRQHEDSFFFSSREHTNIISMLASTFLSNKVIVRLPNMPNNKLYGKQQTVKQQLMVALNRFLLKRRADLIIAQNNQMKEQIIELYGVREKLVVINNPVDKTYILNSIDRNNKVFPTTGPNLLSVGNVSYAKGYDILLEAFKKVQSKNTNVNLYIIGRYNSEYAKAFISRYNGQRGVHFLGFKENPYNYMDQCDVFVLPSRMEGFPNVVLEALTLNKKIVSSDCIDVINQLIVPGKNGFICHVGNTDELAEMILKAIDLKCESFNYTLFDEEKFVSLFN